MEDTARVDSFADAVVATLNARMSKVSMPSMPNGVRRRGMFERLDRLTGALIWLSAPAGYGKSMAVSAYLRERQRACVWYRCDAGDEDIASFFRHVTATRALETTLDEALMALPSGDRPALHIFCRNFFRRWFRGSSPGSTLVFDDWHELPQGCALATLLPLIVDETPAGFQIIVISRHRPDALTSRLAASASMGVLDVADLALSKAETRSIARLQSSSARMTVDALYANTRGWAAGVVLHLRPPVNGGLSTIFDYLAVEVFERLDDKTQLFLMHIACLERIRPRVAARLTQRTDAAAVLDGLVQHNVFITYSASADEYELHPLFGDFLQRRRSPAFTADAAREQLLAAALAEIAEGAVDAGVHLLLRTGAWREAAESINAAAQSLVHEARYETLTEWLNALPTNTVATDGWLLYWRGVCRMVLDFAAARGDLEAAFVLLSNAAQPLGQMLACAAVLQHIAHSYSDYRAMLPWIDRLGCLLDATREFPSSHGELKVRSTLMLALSQAFPDHPQMTANVERVSTLVRAEPSLVCRADGASALLHFFSRFGRTVAYGDLDIVVDGLLSDPALPSTYRIHLMWMQAYQLHSSGQLQRVLVILGNARALARAAGLHLEDMRMRLCELQAQEIGASTTAALATFSELEPQVRALPPIPRAHFFYVRSLFELACGNLREALLYAEQSLPIIRSSHWHIGEALCLTGLAEVYCAHGRHADALRSIDECLAITKDVEAPLVEFNMQLVRAEIARHGADAAEFKLQLGRALCLGREQGYANGFHTSSQLLSRHVACGMALGIEPSYCRWVIARRAFRPPVPAPRNWPWPVKIRTFGSLRIYIEDAELTFYGKTQRKPLDLLKALAAQPPGTEMTHLIDWLWPDLDGDAARNALDIALHRLRKMLKARDAVRLVQGRVALNTNVVWIDTWALEHYDSEGVTREDLCRARDELFELYTGHFLEAEELSGSQLATRDRMWSLFVRSVRRLAQLFEERGRYDIAESLYERARSSPSSYTPLAAGRRRRCVASRHSGP